MLAAILVQLGAPGAPARAADSEPTPPVVPIPEAVPRATMVRTEQPPRIDGRLDDPAWESATVLDGFRQVDPEEGEPVTEATEVRLLYDANYLYVAFRCLDREPDGIVATRMRRDGSLSTDDNVAFVIDPYFDRRNGFFFEMNAVGAKTDALIEANRSIFMDWDGIWEGKATIDDEGWYAEMAIPFQTISFDPDTSQWSFNAVRFIRRRTESSRWAAVSRDLDFNSFSDAGVLEGLHDLEQGLGLDVAPFVKGGYTRDSRNDENDFDSDVGLDVFYKFTPSMTLALTVNTDFAETEVDERRVNLTRFPLFFPEKRDFFLQDKGIFDFGGIFRNPLAFNSRRIGIGPDGEQRDILAGVKLTGRQGGLNLGLIDVQMKEDDDLGRKNFFVGRASVDVLEQSTIGGIFTYGSPNDLEDNIVGGMDFNYRTTDFADGKTVTGNLFFLQSETEDATGAQHAYGLKLDYPNDRVDWNLGYTYIDDQYDAKLGFVPRRGIKEYFGGWRYRWRPESDIVRWVQSGPRAQWVTDLDDSTESGEVSWKLVELRFESDDELTFDGRYEREVLLSDFEIADGVVIPAGDYDWERWGATWQSSRARSVDVKLSYRGGDFYTGSRDEYSVEGNWRISRHLNLGAEFEMNDVSLDEGDFITRIIRGRVNVYFTPDLSWQSFVQFDNQSDSIGLNSRVRWIVRPGSDVYFVVNQTVDRDESSFVVRETELVSKVGWTFRF